MKNFFKKSLAVITSIITAGMLAAAPVSAADFRNGDTNFDGMIDLYDAINISKHIAKKPELTGDALISADYNKDGKVNLYDAIMVSIYMVAESKINQFAKLVNDDRNENGVSALILDYDLTDASVRRAYELTQFWSKEIRPDNTSYRTIFSQYGIDYKLDEKYAVKGAKSADKLYEELIKDPDRLATFRSEEFTKIGIGYCGKNDESKYYWSIFLIK
ncbi:MAG: dockerin type I domain-containing protein [Clostridium sp.]|nr:dockerin type I domain-containing protein [Clostridium sp.]